MSVIRRRRSRAVSVGLLASALGLVAAAGLGFVGARTLADSTAGRSASDDGRSLATQRFPFTSTALLGAVDDDGRLTSLVVAVLAVDGSGGSIVELPVSADPSSGNAEQLEPIDSVLAVDGPDAFREAIERLTSLSFDLIEIADEERFAVWMQPLEPVSVELPGPVVDVSTGRFFEAGDQTLAAIDLAALVTAVDPEQPAWAYQPARTAVWSAVTARVGAGVGSPVAGEAPLSVPDSTDEFLARLYAGGVAFRSLQFFPVEDAASRIAPAYLGAFGRGTVDAAVVVDRAESLMVFGGIAPARLGAPLDAPTFRIVNALDDDDTAPLEMTPADLTRMVINVLMFSRVNVVSTVNNSVDEVPEVTLMRTQDPGSAAQLEATYEPVFGPVEVVLSEVLIDGVDVEIVLGRSFVDQLARDRDAVAAG